MLHRSVHPNASRIRSHNVLPDTASSIQCCPSTTDGTISGLDLNDVVADTATCQLRAGPRKGRSQVRSHLLSRAVFAIQAGPPQCQWSAAISAASRTVANATTARSVDTHSTDSHAEPWLSSHYHLAPRGLRFHHNRRNRSAAAVSGPACRLRCRPITLAPPSRLLRKLLAAEGLPRAARRQARNPPGLRPLGHARPPTRTHRHLGAASHRARYAGEADPDRTPAPVVHQIGVQAQGLPTVCCLCTTQISRTTTPRPGPCHDERASFPKWEVGVAGMSSSSVAEPSNSVHPVVRIVERARWHEAAKAHVGFGFAEERTRARVRDRMPGASHPHYHRVHTRQES